MGARIYSSESFLGFHAPRGRPPYQMVPVGSTRLIDVETGREDCVLRTLDDRIVSIAALERIELWGREHYKYPLYGVSEGRTHVVMEDHRGDVQAELIVSVKERLVMEYSVILLADSRRQTTRLAPLAQIMMGGVTQLLLQQANVELKPRGGRGPMLVKVDSDLGTPLDVTPERFDAILRAMPVADRFPTNTFQVFFTWQLKSHDKGFDKLGFNWEETPHVFVGDDAGAYTLAHELVHALGVWKHNKEKKSLMFPIRPENPQDNSPQMLWYEIDAVNLSGV